MEYAYLPTKHDIIFFRFYIFTKNGLAIYFKYKVILP